MDENLLSLLEELSLRSCGSEDECYPRTNGAGSSSNYTQYSSSNVSSPNYDQLTNSMPDEDIELKQAVTSLFQDLKPGGGGGEQGHINNGGYDKSKLLVALLGNTDLVTCAIKKISQLVSLGKKMEQIYRCYYRDPNVELDLDKISQLIATFSSIYNSESYVREVNVSRVYQAYCVKLLDIYNYRMKTQAHNNGLNNRDDEMIS